MSRCKMTNDHLPITHEEVIFSLKNGTKNFKKVQENNK